MPSYEQNPSSKLWSVRFRETGEDQKRHQKRLSGFKTKRDARLGYEAYCLERNNGIDAQYFIDYYTNRHWKIGGTNKTMVDWKGAIRTWERKNGGGSSKTAKADTPINPFMREDVHL
jgi:hypothetical protein